MKSKFFMLVCTLILLLLTGCAQTLKDDFAEGYEYFTPPTVEGVTAQTEFAEYDGNTEVIYVTVINDTDEIFPVNEFFLLDKKVGDEWRRIRTEGFVYGFARKWEPHTTETFPIKLKDFTKLPLLPGHYRVWVGDLETDIEYIQAVPAEFDVK